MKTTKHGLSQKEVELVKLLLLMLEIVFGVIEQITSQRRSMTALRVLKISFLNPRLRTSFQICSIGFISGVYGGKWKISMFFGISRPFDLCHAAPSATNRMKSFRYAFERLCRNMFMQSVLQYGKTRKNESPVIGSTAPYAY